MRTGTIDGRDEAEDIQNLLVCAEMLGAALCMLVAFPWVSGCTAEMLDGCCAVHVYRLGEWCVIYSSVR